MVASKALSSGLDNDTLVCAHHALWLALISPILISHPSPVSPLYLQLSR